MALQRPHRWGHDLHLTPNTQQWQAMSALFVYSRAGLADEGVFLIFIATAILFELGEVGQISYQF
jgi:hypothetical protein